MTARTSNASNQSNDTTHASRDQARQAVSSLHAHQFGHVWSGVTSVAANGSGGETVAIQAPGFFSLKSQNLVDALVEYGIAAATAGAIEPTISAGETIVIVYVEEIFSFIPAR